MDEAADPVAETITSVFSPELAAAAAAAETGVLFEIAPEVVPGSRFAPDTTVACMSANCPLFNTEVAVTGPTSAMSVSVSPLIDIAPADIATTQVMSDFAEL
jgi:hypothetical protein